MQYTYEEIGQRAKKRSPELSKFSDLEVGERIVKRTPEKFTGLIKQAQQTQQSSIVPKKLGILEKTAGYVDKVMGPVSQFLAGSTGKAAGGLIVGATGAAEKIIAQATGNEKLMKRGKELSKIGEKNATPTNAAFMALEQLPGGSGLLKWLKKIPGGSYIAEGLIKLSGTARGKAIKLYTQALAPTKEGQKYLASKVVPELIDRGTVALTRSGLLKKTEKMKAKAGDLLENIIEQIPEATKIKTQPVLDAIEQSKQQFFVKGTTVAAEPLAIKKADQIKSVVEELGSEVSFESLRSLRQIWDKTISQASGFVGKTLKEGTEIELKKEATNAIRNELAKAFPNLAKINAEYTFWKRTNDILTETIKRTTPQKGKLMQELGTITGAVIGQSMGPAGSVLGAQGLKYLTKIIESTGWKTVSAITLDRLSTAIVNGDKKVIIEILRRMTTGSKNILDYLKD